jgi:hypothetical protein
MQKEKWEVYFGLLILENGEGRRSPEEVVSQHARIEDEVEKENPRRPAPRRLRFGLRDPGSIKVGLLYLIAALVVPGFHPVVPSW